MSPATALLIEMLGAAALLIAGLRSVKAGVSAAFGDKLRRWLELGTRRRAGAFLSGLLATMALQSSTATALIVATFAGRDLMSGTAAQVVLLGANLGTAVVALLLAAGPPSLAPVFVLAGVAIASSQASRRRGLGQAILGIGLMLLALRLLGAAGEKLGESAVLHTLLGALEDAPLLALLVGGALAVVGTSSLAVVLLVAALATAGDIGPGLALALVAGANLGGAVPPVLATRREPAGARRVTVGNLIVRGIGAVAVVAAIAPLAALAERHAPGPAMLVIGAHLAFNLVLAAVALPFAGPIASLARRLVPGDDEPNRGPRYLDPAALDTPAAAVGCAAREALRIGDLVESMLVRSLEAFRTDDPDLIAGLPKLDDEVDRLQNAVKLYLARLGEDLDPGLQQRSAEIIDYVVNLEHIGDIVEKGLAALAQKKIRNGLVLSPDGQAEILAFHQATIDNLRKAQTVFVGRDVGLARALFESKVEVRRMERQSAEKHLERLRAGKAESLRTSALHLDLLRDLKRINAHVAAVAQSILDEHGDLRESRLRTGATAEQPAAKAQGEAVV